MTEPEVPIVHAPATVVVPPPSEPGVERSAKPLSPTTTAESDRAALAHEEAAERKSEGQRHINVMWEGTQKNIAIMVTAVVLVVCAYCVMWPGAPLELRLLAFTLLSNVFFSVIVTYFQRTNHTKTGGVGADTR